MFTVRIQLVSSDGSKETIFCEDKDGDYRRGPMAKALEGAGFFVTTKGGNPATMGVLAVTMVPWSDSVVEKYRTKGKELGSILLAASWDYRTMIGYGTFMEEVLVLKNELGNL